MLVWFVFTVVTFYLAAKISGYIYQRFEGTREKWEERDKTLSSVTGAIMLFGLLLPTVLALFVEYPSITSGKPELFIFDENDQMIPLSPKSFYLDSWLDEKEAVRADSSVHLLPNKPSYELVSYTDKESMEVTIRISCNIRDLEEFFRKKEYRKYRGRHGLEEGGVITGNEFLKYYADNYTRLSQIFSSEYQKISGDRRAKSTGATNHIKEVIETEINSRLPHSMYIQVDVTYYAHSFDP